MTSENSQLHVVFGNSAAGTLQQVLNVAGRQEMVVTPHDDFSFGPIDKADNSARAQWVENELGYCGWDEVSADSLRVLSASIEAAKPPIAWVSPDNARSVAGFLWWLSHMDGKDCQVLDVPGLSLLGPDALGQYLDQAVPLSRERREICLALWKKLKAENAPFRVLIDNGLISAPIEYFDPLLLKHIAPEWQKMAMIVGRALWEFAESGIYQTGDLVLAARLTHLAETGILEWQGELGDMARCKLRLQPSGYIS